MARGSGEACTVHTIKIISQWQYFVGRCVSSYVDNGFGSPSRNVGDTHPHTLISVDSVTREVEAGPSSVVKHVQVTAKHAVTSVEWIRYRPGRRDTIVAEGLRAKQEIIFFPDLCEPWGLTLRWKGASEKLLNLLRKRVLPNFVRSEEKKWQILLNKMMQDKAVCPYLSVQYFLQRASSIFRWICGYWFA
jgi:hypothetical protein